MGSVNPVFVTPDAAAARRDDIATGYVGSYLLGAGQFCTKPGLLLVPAEHAAMITDAIAGAVRDRSAAPLLTGAIAAGHADARTALARQAGVETVLGAAEDEQTGTPSPMLLATDAATLLSAPDPLAHECFGPTSLVVSYRNADALRGVLGLFTGELTATVHGESGESLAGELVTAAARFAGRVLWNGWPTGVAVTHAQQHGGPYPATTTPFSSVGTTSIRRFQRPVAFQDVPDEFLPPALRDANPWEAARRLDGRREQAPAPAG